MTKHIFIVLFSLCFSISTLAQFQLKQNNNTKPYPYGNPVITHMYTADAAPKVMPDGRLWMVTSVDHEDGGGYATMHAIHAFSTDDMINWVDHGEILSIEDFDEPEGEDWAIWAPDIVYRNGLYYLYYPIRIAMPDGSVDRFIGVAVSERMDQRFKVVNHKMKGVPRAGLDPSVFIDDDGVAYLYWNQALMGVLQDDMLDIDGEAFKLDYGSNNFMEAAWMHKRKGIYYYNYHTKYSNKVSIENPDDPQRQKSHLDYSMGDSPQGPLKHMGVINKELGVNVKNAQLLPGANYVPWRLTQSNHGAVVEYHGQEYFFYHTSALSSWRQDEFKGPGTWTQRSVCVDYLNYREDGTAIPVQQTIEGVAAIKVDQPFEIMLQKKKKKIKATNEELKFENIDLGSGYYYFGLKASGVKEPIKAEVRLGSPDGILAGTLLINKKGVAETFLREANVTQDIYLVFNGKVKVKDIRVFAVSPLPIK